MSKTVIILGGGVAGMSAAHELLTRGFKVKVYEHKHIAGGKARSMPATGSGSDGRKDLPGEHGFRFFPRFYKHLPDTMKEIPLGNGKTVFDNLVEATRIEIARYGMDPIIMTSRFPRSLADLKVIFNDMFKTEYGFKPGEVDLFAHKIWQLMTSCNDRRLDEYEKIGWWDYIEADGKSHAYITLLAEGLTRTLVAAQPQSASTRTGGDILLQLMFDIMSPGMSSDRVLNAPTNDAWINPWLKWMETEFKDNFEYHFNHQVESINCDTRTKKITSAKIAKINRGENGKMSSLDDAFEATGDYFISAMPIEVIAPMISKEMIEVDSTLTNLKTLAPNVNWMNGMQFYLNENITLDHGHAIYADSEWALTSISQIQFWDNFPIEEYGNGKVKGVLSIDISDWFSKGIIYGKEASNCTREEIKEEVWAQLKKSLNVNGKEILKDEMIEHYWIDPDIITPHSDRPTQDSNVEPLLVNKVNTWHLRPTAHTMIKNFMVTGDFVQTNTDLATMEGANESARRAVNSIIQDAGVDVPYCKIWPLHEPDILAIWRAADEAKFKKGMSWDGKLDLWRSIIVWFKNLFK